MTECHGVRVGIDVFQYEGLVPVYFLGRLAAWPVTYLAVTDGRMVLIGGLPLGPPPYRPGELPSRCRDFGTIGPVQGGAIRQGWTP